MEWPIFNAVRGSEVVDVVKRGQIMPVLKTKGSWVMVAFPSKTTTKGPLGVTTKSEEKTGWMATKNSRGLCIVHSVHAAEAFIKVVATLRKKRGKNVVIGGAKKSLSLLSAWQERRCFLLVRRPEASKVRLFTVTVCANPANDLTCPPSYITFKTESHPRQRTGRRCFARALLRYRGKARPRSTSTRAKSSCPLLTRSPKVLALICTRPRKAPIAGGSSPSSLPSRALQCRTVSPTRSLGAFG